MVNKKIEVPKAVSKTESLFYNELKNFKDEKVTITSLKGQSIHAKVIAIEFNNLHFIIEFDDGVKEIIKGESIQSIRLGNKIEKK